MNIVLAPMEGLADEIMRAVLTRVADVDWCVTEFVRVTGSLLPPRAFWRISPELEQGARTRAGTPVHLQLLGSDPGCMGDNAARAAELGAPVVDLNFGCPAPNVNRHRGGAVLLQEPELLYDIAHACRRALPADVPLTAKMRLGFHDKSRAMECAQALQAGGASRLVVHARTRDEGYRPPAHWEWIARVQQAVQIPVIANGEIWSVEDYLRCRSESGIQDVMLGRGLIARPGLAAQIRAAADGKASVADSSWAVVLDLLIDYFERAAAKLQPRHAPGRLKLWLRYLERNYPQAAQLLQEVRTSKEPEPMLQRLRDDLQSAGQTERV